jgi:hypothetical protein
MTRERQHENAGLVRAIVAVDSRPYISRSIFDITHACVMVPN